MMNALKNFFGQFRWREGQLVYVDKQGMGRLTKKSRIMRSTFFRPLCWVHGPTFSLWFSYTQIRTPEKEWVRNYLEMEAHFSS